MRLVQNSDDTVLATVARSHTGPLLTAIHRGGFGHLTKVLDATRSPVLGQLHRAGVDIPAGFTIGPDQIVVMISAPARTGAALDLLMRHGAAETWTSRRSSAQPPMFNTPLSLRARAAPPPADGRAAD